MRLDEQILHDERIATPERRTGRQILGRHGNFLVNRQILGLGAFLRAGPLAISRRSRDGRLAERAGLAVGRGLLRALETSDFRFEGRDALGLFFDHPQQETHEGSFVFLAEGRNHLLPRRRHRPWSLLAQAFVASSVLAEKSSMGPA